MHELRKVMTPQDWAALHSIRRATLFAPGRHADEIVYDDHHPDDRNPANQCFLLTYGGRPIGVVRLDPRGDKDGVVRLVAVVPDQQRRGHGRAMSELIDAEARRRGMNKLLINAHGSAVGFYERTGWAPETWDPGELLGIAAHCTQMTKRL